MRILFGLILSSFFAFQANALQRTLITCNDCNEQGKQAAVTLYASVNQGPPNAEYVVMDFKNANFSIYSVRKSGNTNPFEQFDISQDRVQPQRGGGYVDVTRHRALQNQKELESYLFQAQSELSQITNQFNGSLIKLPASSNFKSVADAYTVSKDVFLDVVTHYLQSENTSLVYEIKKAQAMLAELSSNVSVSLSSVIAAVAVHLNRDITATVEFSDGTKLKIKIKIVEDLSTGFELQIVDMRLPTLASGKLMPREVIELMGLHLTEKDLNLDSFERFLRKLNEVKLIPKEVPDGKACIRDIICNQEGTVCYITDCD